MSVPRARVILWALICQSVLALVFARAFPLEPGVAPDPDLARSAIVRILGVPPDAVPPDFPDARNSAYGDAAHYLRMAMGLESIPPYSLRPIYPAMIGAIAGVAADPVSDPGGFLRAVPGVVTAVNLVLAGVTAGLIWLSALKLGAGRSVALALAGLGAVNVGSVQTWSFAMPDIASYAVAAGAVLCFAWARWAIMAVVVALGVLVKDVLIVYSILLLYPVLIGEGWRGVLWAALPVAVFVALRASSGVDPLSVQYGWDVSRGDIRLDYFWNHLKTPHLFVTKVAFALAAPIGLALWLAPPRREVLPWLVLLVLAAVIAADLLLASRVSRIVFVAYPALALLIAWRIGRTA